MQTISSTKFGFRIRTRGGVTVDNLLIFGKNQAEAEGKLRQVYPGCEIVETRPQIDVGLRTGPVTYEDVVDLISAG
jgi:hypothetical protein